MPSAPSAPTNGAVLRWARLQAGLEAAEAADRLHVKQSQVNDWESNINFPTINQLRNAAKLYRRTAAFFFLPEEPASDDLPVPPDFRAAGGSRVGPELTREIAKARERRTAYLNLSQDALPAFPEIGSVLEKPEASAREFRRMLGLTQTEQYSFKDATVAFRRWVSAVEDMGVLVFHMSRIDLSECRGASVFEQPAPVILLNGADDPQARIFTLLHECAHLLTHSGGVCGVYADTETERKCNLFAGELLMPGDELLKQLGTENPINALSRLSARFRVSQSAIAVRLRDLGRIRQDQLDEQLALALRLSRERRERDRQKPGGPPHHMTHLRNLGGTYVATVLDALHDDRISAIDASYFLEAKSKTIVRMEAELATRAVPA